MQISAPIKARVRAGRRFGRKDRHRSGDQAGDETERGKGEARDHHLESVERRDQLEVRGDDSGRAGNRE